MYNAMRPTIYFPGLQGSLPSTQKELTINSFKPSENPVKILTPQPPDDRREKPRVPHGK